MGSGTTAISSIKNKRCYVGFELNPDYCQMIEQRIDKHNKGEKSLLNAVEDDVKITNFQQAMNLF
ncbi:MAG: site-specific DNA-methyltransferase [Endomicrobium sp.]|nr:site-specific DNA-methyltransferase [Endomicrobium sp.]